MSKVISSQAKKWAKHKKKLSSGRAAYWDYVELLIEIVDSASFLEEYANQAEFLKDEAGYTDRHFRALKVQCEVRQRIGDAVPENTLSLLSGKQLGEISKAPSEKQVEVYATASQAAEAEGRAIETDDLKKALKKVAPKTKTPKPTSGDSPLSTGHSGAVESSVERQPGDESEEGGMEPVVKPPKPGSTKDLPGPVHKQAVTSYFSPLARATKKLADMNGGEGPVYREAKKHLNAFSAAFKKLGKGEQ